METDHSIFGYLQRRTTQELTVILQSCLKEEMSDYGAELAEMVRQILQNRKTRDNRK